MHLRDLFELTFSMSRVEKSVFVAFLCERFWHIAIVADQVL